MTARAAPSSEGMRPILIRIAALLVLTTPACTFGRFPRPNERVLDALPPGEGPWDGYGLLWMEDAMGTARR